MLEAGQRRQAAGDLQSKGISQRRACELAGLSRTVFQYPAQEKDDADVIARLQEHARRHPREGSRKAGAALRREGTRANHKKVERIWHEQGLTVRSNVASEDGARDWTGP